MTGHRVAPLLISGRFYFNRRSIPSTSAKRRLRRDLLLGLSPMTMPHELARVVLAEQIYRAFTALRGHPYPR